ncbi:non-canonical poly(A) RNA polymerase PAPD7-like [Citrus clementina]|uniref:non-canonical poly(A) RNA polymerase PAPD7-like n=1 Tax=Citrus clementina TaxID=85681 RepID=UPI000CED6C5F|nr:non-canonical poly(A) RNA polymerase PAPD7-like [Citrus x clementina]
MTKNKRHYYNELTFNSKLQLLTTTGTNRPVEPSSRWFKGNSRFKSPMLQMHKEIVDFCDFLSPTSEEREVRTTAGEAVLDLFKYTWPKCKPKVFGTFRTGLYLPTSDIDVVIMESGIHNPATGLQALSRALLQQGIAKKIQSLYECRASPEHNLEILLVNFFDFYGRKLKTTDVGVSCKGAGSFFKKSSKGFTNKGQPFLIAIEDPQAPDNDIGKNSFNYF